MTEIHTQGAQAASPQECCRTNWAHSFSGQQKYWGCIPNPPWSSCQGGGGAEQQQQSPPRFLFYGLCLHLVMWESPVRSAVQGGHLALRCSRVGLPGCPDSAVGSVGRLQKRPSGSGSRVGTTSQYAPRDLLRGASMHGTPAAKMLGLKQQPHLSQDAAAVRSPAWVASKYRCPRRST